MQQNQAQEIQIQNLMEELKLTKDAAGDSGQQLSELTKNLRIAKESAKKLEIEAKDIELTLGTRTANFLKEKKDLQLQLEKALADLKNKSSNSSELIAENNQLKSDLKASNNELYEA